MGLGEKLKEMVNEESGLLKTLLWLYNHIPLKNSIKKHGNTVKVTLAFLKKCKVRIYGRNNTIIIEKGSRLTRCNFIIQGNDNVIKLSDFTTANCAEFYIEDDGNEITVNRHTNFAGKIHLACTEGKSITIGEDCLFSSDVVIRTGDSHSVTDLEGNRINQAKDVKIGNHVWIGHRALLNKGVEIADDSIIGTGAVVTRKFDRPNVCIAGNPAKIVKEDVNWKNERF